MLWQGFSTFFRLRPPKTGSLQSQWTRGGGVARNSNTPRTYGRRGGGGGARCVTIALKKEDKYASGLMLRQTPDRALKNRTVRIKPDVYLSSFFNLRPPGRVSAPPQGGAPHRLRTTVLWYHCDEKMLSQVWLKLMWITLGILKIVTPEIDDYLLCNPLVAPLSRQPNGE